jgi:hypothetical protein
MDGFWLWLGIGSCVFLCYAGHAISMWASHRWPPKTS